MVPGQAVGHGVEAVLMLPQQRLERLPAGLFYGVHHPTPQCTGRQSANRLRSSARENGLYRIAAPSNDSARRGEIRSLANTTTGARRPQRTNHVTSSTHERGSSESRSTTTAAGGGSLIAMACRLAPRSVRNPSCSSCAV